MKNGKIITLTKELRVTLRQEFSEYVKNFLDKHDLQVTDESDVNAQLKHNEEELKSALSQYQDLLDSKTPLAEETHAMIKDADRLAKEKYDTNILKINDIYTACQFGFINYVEQECKKFWLPSSRKEFLNTPNADGFAAIHFAAYHGHGAMIHLLVDYGANPDQLDRQGYSAMHWAAKAGQLPAVQVLMAKKANVNAKGEYGRTPLHMSAFNSNLQVTTWLLQHGALINEKTGDEDNAKPAFFEAVIHGDAELAKIFLKEKTLDVNAVDKQGYSALYHAASDGQARLLPFILGHSNYKYPAKNDLNHPKKLLEMKLRYNVDETKRLLNEFLKANPEQ